MNDPLQALRCPPARGWRRSRASIPENMRARMAADEARAWSHSQTAGQLWESGWRLARATAAAEKIDYDENKCCNTAGNAGDLPRRQSGGTAPAGCREPLENTKMTTISLNEINSAGIQAQGKIDGITEVELIGTNGKNGDAKTTAYWFGGTRVIATNGDPIWEESDPEAFAAMIEEIEA